MINTFSYNWNQLAGSECIKATAANQIASSFLYWLDCIVKHAVSARYLIA